MICNVKNSEFCCETCICTEEEESSVVDDNVNSCLAETVHKYNRKYNRNYKQQEHVSIGLTTK